MMKINRIILLVCVIVWIPRPTAISENINTTPHVAVGNKQSIPPYRQQGSILVVTQTPHILLSETWVLGHKHIAEHVWLLQFDENKIAYDTVVHMLGQHAAVQAFEANWALHLSQYKAHDTYHAVTPVYAPDVQNKQTIRVGVLDTGIDFTHEILKNSTHVGASFVASMHDSSEMDYHGHGTRVAGVIAQTFVQSTPDISPYALEMYGIKIFNDDGIGYLDSVLSGLAWAIKARMHIVNMSFGLYTHSALLQEAVLAADKAGVHVVAAAGNEHTPYVNYPAAYPTVFAIGSYKDYQRVSDFSNWGAAVDMFVPGELWRTSTPLHVNAQGEEIFSGTSAAAACATGLLAATIAHDHDTIAIKAHMAQYTIDKMLHVKHMQHDYLQQSYQHIHATALDVPHVIDTNTGIQVRYRFDNIGNQALQAQPMQLIARVDDNGIEQYVPLTFVLPFLDTHASYTHTFLLPPFKHHNQVCLAFDVASLNITQGLENHCFVATNDMYANMIIEDLSITPLALHVRLRNIGNSANAPGISLYGAAEQHAYAITNVIDVPILQPEEAITLQLPMHHNVFESSDTLVYAVLKQDVQMIATHQRLYHVDDHAGVQTRYAQVNHRFLVQQALDVLLQQGLFIEDVHGTMAPYRGDVDHFYNWGSATKQVIHGVLGLQPVWQWQKKSHHMSWQDYPLQFKTLFDGANAPDSIDVVYGHVGAHLWDSHFWLVDEGDDAGVSGHPSALQAIEALVYGKEVATAPTLPHLEGAIAAYERGDKAKAWWLIGHAVHLLADLSTSAHTLSQNQHGHVGDIVHDWFESQGALWSSAHALQAGGFLDPTPYGHNFSERLRFLVYTTAQIGGTYPWHETKKSWYKPHLGPLKDDGNRVWGGSMPHYEAFLNAFFADIPDHPHFATRDLASDEVCYFDDGHCEFVPYINTQQSRLAMCVADKGGLLQHVDTNNAHGLHPNQDGDLTRIADVAYVYSMRAIAGLIYLFAQATNQL